jgi:hypothetical protein
MPKRKGWDCKKHKHRTQAPAFIPPDISKRKAKELRQALPRLLWFLCFHGFHK